MIFSAVNWDPRYNPSNLWQSHYPDPGWSLGSIIIPRQNEPEPCGIEGEFQGSNSIVLAMMDQDLDLPVRVGLKAVAYPCSGNPKLQLGTHCVGLRVAAATKMATKHDLGFWRWAVCQWRLPQ